MQFEVDEAGLVVEELKSSLEATEEKLAVSRYYHWYSASSIKSQCSLLLLASYFRLVVLDFRK